MVKWISAKLVLTMMLILLLQKMLFVDGGSDDDDGWISLGNCRRVIVAAAAGAP